MSLNFGNSWVIIFTYGMARTTLKIHASQFIVLLFACFFVSGSALAQGYPPIRVGIVAAKDFEEKFSRYNNLFFELQKISKDNHKFSIALGTYKEVEDWYSRRLIDVAILPPGSLFLLNNYDIRKELESSYVASLAPLRNSGRTFHDLYPSESRPQREYPRYNDEKVVGASDTNPDYIYRSVCVVREDSPIKNAFDFDRLARERKLTFLFEHPLSIAGYLLPKYVLEGRYISLTKNQTVFTQSQEESLQQLYEDSEESRYKVAFVSDDVVPDPKLVRKLVLPAGEGTYGIYGAWDVPSGERVEHIGNLDEYLIPREVVLINYNLDKETRDFYKSLLQGIFLRKDQAAGFKIGVRKDWLRDHHYLYKWMHKIAYRSGYWDSYSHASIEDIVMSAHKYKLITNQEPRIALVLSGGGAKCAYQAGAIVQIEKRLEELRKAGQTEANIGLVVGTSGGAINALCTAMNISAGPRGQDAFRRMWGTFTLKDFFQLWPVLLLYYGVCIALLHLRLVTKLIMFSERRKEKWWLYTGVILALLGVLELILALIKWGPGDIQSKISPRLLFLERAWFLMQLTCQAAFIWLFVLSLIVLAIGLLHSRTKFKISFPDVYIPQIVCFGLVASSFFLLSFLFTSWVISVVIAVSIIGAIFWLESIKGQDASESLKLGFFITILPICISFYSLPLGLFSILPISCILLFYKKYRFASPLPFMKHIFFLALLLMAYTASFGVLSFSRATGVERAMVEKIPYLIEESLETKLPLNKNRAKIEQQLSEISQHIIDSKLIKRDLIITASKLPASDASSQINPITWDYESASEDSGERRSETDIYFYYQASDQPTSGDRRFISLSGNNANLLLDVVIGSGSIYPVFPPRYLGNVYIPEYSETSDRTVVNEMNIIDGGFAHNSPIEAAIKWGATHIILIEATADESSYGTSDKPGNFLDSASMAFNYLFDRAQQTDSAMRGQVEIFELRPRASWVNISTFDFSKNAIEDTYEQGAEDVNTNSRFVLIPGIPNSKPVASPLQLR